MSGLQILILVVVIVLVWSWVQGRSRQRSPRAGSGGGARSEGQLAKRVGKAAAARLIDQLHRKYPERSRNWCADKALFDLERDRRY